MKTTTQRKLSKRLDIDPSLLSKILKGKKKPTPSRAAALEKISGIGIRTWLFGLPREILTELEKAYGPINFKRGRLPGKREVKQ